MSAALVLTSVSKSYPLGSHRVSALLDVSLRVNSGELLAITGPSGSGKSTLLNMAGLIDVPDTGTVELDQVPTAPLNEKERAVLRRNRIGFIFQSFNLIPVMNVAENVDYPLFLQGVSGKERRKRVAEMLRAVGLEGHASHRPDKLSGGQRQRVAIARALIKKPSIIVADEPTANLDSSTALQVLSLMRTECHEEGCAFLVATHDARVTSYCDRVVSVVDGGLK